MDKFSPTIKLRSREVDTQNHSPRGSVASSVPSTEKYLFTSDGKRFHASNDGAKSAADHERFLAVCKKGGISSPPPSQKNLFGEPSGSEAEENDKDECARLKEALSDMTAELERSRAMLGVKFAEVQEREDNLESIIQDYVNKALLAYMKSHQVYEPKPVPILVAASAPVPGYIYMMIPLTILALQ